MMLGVFQMGRDGVQCCDGVLFIKADAPRCAARYKSILFPFLFLSLRGFSPHTGIFVGSFLVTPASCLAAVLGLCASWMMGVTVRGAAVLTGSCWQQAPVAGRVRVLVVTLQDQFVMTAVGGQLALQQRARSKALKVSSWATKAMCGFSTILADLKTQQGVRTSGHTACPRRPAGFDASTVAAAAFWPLSQRRWHGTGAWPAGTEGLDWG